VAWASSMRKEIESVYSVGEFIKFLDGTPGAETIYQAPTK
jgi:hypothetical protein